MNPGESGHRSYADAGALPVTNPTCVCLGGAGLRTLFITSARKFLDAAKLRVEPLAGSVLALEVEVPGLEEQRFAL